MDTSIADLLGATSAPAPSPDRTETKSNELGQDDFMKLMLTQLRYQDPLKPVDNTEFIAQTAQFSSVAGINSMRDSLDRFVEDQGTLRSLYSASLLGKTAMVNASEVKLQADTPVEIEFSLPNPVDYANALFLDQTGEVVQKKSLGAHASGDHSFIWQGVGDESTQLAPGTYSIRIEYPDISGKTNVAQISIASRIDSVVLGNSNSGAVLNTSDGKSVTLSDVHKIKNS